MLKFALRGLNIGAETGSEQNGERRAAELVRGILEGEHPPLYVFDVGANRGGFSRMILAVFANTNVQVHLFEPSRTLFEDLSKQMTDRGVVLNAVALSDQTGEGTLHTSPLHPSLGSLHAREISAETSLPLEERVALDTVDTYCQKHDIPHVHFLKMDVEGHEMAVLRGASAMLSSGHVSIIQFEFGGANLDSRTYFRDFWNLLTPRFCLYRILKDGLYRIEAYHALLEQFTYSNYVAISSQLVNDPSRRTVFH